MKYYRQINQFLIERYPIIWNTHFIPILFIGFLLHLLYFYLGYINLDLLFLKRYSISNSFYTNYSFGIYSIICLLTFIYFGFRFFTHNSFLNFYPIGPLYFWKNFAIVFTSIFVFLTVNVSFENGMKAKLDRLLPEKERNQIIDDINLAYPFLFNDVNQYRIDQRGYPKPFPLTELSRIESNDDKANQIRRNHRINEEKPYLNFNGSTYQFGHLQEKQLDSCNSEIEVKDYVDVSGVDNLEEYSFYNFSRIFLSKEEAYQQYSIDDISENMRENQFVDIAPKLHQIYKNKDQKAIEKILSNLIKHCKKFRIAQNLNPEKMSKAILTQDLNQKALVYTKLSSPNESDLSQHEDVESSTTNMNFNVIDENSNLNYYVDLPVFININRNYIDIKYDTGFSYLVNKTIWGWIFISMILAFGILYFKFIPIKELIVGMVFAGILGSLYGTILLLRFFQPNETNIQYILFSIFYLIGIIIMGIRYIYKNSISKSLATSWYLPLTISIILLPISIYTLLYQLATIEVPDACGNISVNHRIEFYPFVFFLLSLCSAFILFRLLKKLHSKPA